MGVLHVDKLQASERPLADALNAAMGHGGETDGITCSYFPVRLYLRLDFIKLRSTLSSSKEGFFLPSSQNK